MAGGNYKTAPTKNKRRMTSPNRPDGGKGRRATPKTEREIVASSEPLYREKPKSGPTPTGGYVARKGMTKEINSGTYTATSLLHADGKFQGPTRKAKLSSPTKKNIADKKRK